MIRVRPLPLSAPAVLLLGLFVLGPAALLVRVSLYEPARGVGFYTPGTVTTENYAAAVGGDGPKLIGFTVLFAGAVAGATLLTAYPVALLLGSLPSCWRWLLLGVVLAPKTAGPLVALFGLQRWLPRGWVGALVGEVYLLAPYAVLVLVVQLRAIDPVLSSAARGLGASARQVFRRVTLPLSLPGLLLAGQLGLMWGLGAYLGPVFLGTPTETTLSVELHRQAFEYNRWPRAAAVAVLLLGLVAASAGLFAGWNRLTRRPR